MKKIFGFIFNKWTLLILGLLALSLLIWWVGPLIAIGSIRPLDPEWARWTLIGLIVLFFVARRLWAVWKARRASDQMAASLAAQSVAPAEKAGDKEVAVLDARFKEALDTLKKSNLSGAKWNQRFGSGYLYHLPWYMFIGAPGSGKTTSLLNSGLEFPLAEKFGKEAIRGVGGTRNCDWWFTNEAILLDTAGRYTTQTSNKEEDAGAWQGFLQLLRKARPRRPINGILLTISVQDLLSQAQPDRERHGTTLRQRVQELYSQLGLRIPIYVLVTKTDLLPGFMEYFENLGKEERAQLLGFTLPFKETQNGLDRAALGNTFSREFAAIEKRLFDGLIDRLEAERDPQRRALVYGFPEQFAGIRDVLGEFLVHTFSSSNFDDAPLIRGVYFTSGTQEDTPIDRIMGLLARSFKVERRVLPSRSSTGRSYFITKLLKDVVFAESELAGTNLKWERRRSLINAAAMALICLAGVATVTAWAFSFVRNKEYLANVATKVPDVTKTVTGFDNVATTDVLQVLPALEDLRKVAIAPPVESDFSAPTSMKFGLFQGDKIDSAAQAAYQRLLTDAFLPRVALRIEEILRKTQADNPEMMYEALKAYLMMHETEHYSADALKAIILADWTDSLPRGVTVDQRQALERHLIALLDRGIVVSPLPMDKALVENARTILSRLSLPQRVYSRMKRLGVGSEFPEFNAVRAGGPNISNIFTRASGIPMTRGPAGMFSYDGYYSGFLKQVDVAAQQLAAEERWVMGLNDQQRQFNLNDANAKLNLSKEVRRIYLEEYAREWKKYLGDIRLRKIKDLNDAIAVTQVLSSVDSPMRSLFRAVAKETTLAEKLDGGQIDKKLNEAAREVDKARESLNKIFSSDRPAAGASSSETLEQLLVDNQFRDIRAWVKAPTPGQPAQIDESVRLLGELYTFMQQVRTAVGSGMAVPQSDVPNKVKAEADRLPAEVREPMNDLVKASTETALTGTRINLGELIQANITPFCTQAISGRYPVVRGSNRDITPEDFAAMFRPGGKMDGFMLDKLFQYVDTTTKVWTFRTTGTGGASMGAAGDSESLAQFQRAQAIRDTFFRNGGNAPSLRLDFRPVEMDASIQQFSIDVDGQQVRYAHGPQVPSSVVWPGSAGRSQVRIQISPPTSSGQSAMIFEGPWALFRMFDRMKIEGSNQPERFRVVFDIDGRKATFDVQTSSVLNPFTMSELRQFGCPTKL